MSDEILSEDTRDFLFYRGVDGSVRVQVFVIDESAWATQKGMADIFGVEVNTVNYHLKEIFKSGELDEISVIRKIRITADDGKNYTTNFYNLDAIIAVGYRVNSYQATQFRIWSTQILKEYLIKGFALDDDRLKQGRNLFGKDYFNELLERIKEIRASERRFWQKVTDLFSECSSDYDKNSPIARTFFATVQNKLEFAIAHKTAPEIVVNRADSKKPHMGLMTWKNAPLGKVLKSDVTVAKNYLTKEEISELNTLVTSYLDYAELQAKRRKLMTMAEWASKLDAFLKFNDYDLLEDAGKIEAAVAKKFAEKEYAKFRVIQDKEYKSDFDKTLDKVIITHELPKESDTISVTHTEMPSFEQTPLNKTLNAILQVPPPPKGKLLPPPIKKKEDNKP